MPTLPLGRETKELLLLACRLRCEEVGRPDTDADALYADLVSMVRGFGADEFDRFWEMYPRHSAKEAARKAWDRAVKKAPADKIIAGASRYRRDRNRLDQFTKHPATWLNQGCWEDDPLPPRDDERAAPRVPTKAERVNASVDRAVQAVYGDR